MGSTVLRVIPLPNDKILDWSKFKPHADDKINVTQHLNIVLGRVEKLFGKMRKCYLPPFSPFTKMFSKGLFFKGRLKSGLCGKGLK